MTDRELLEMAAKAAGMDGWEWDEEMQCIGRWKKDEILSLVWQGWNPLIDDGDALRLAAHLKIDIEWRATNPFPEDTVEAYRSNPEGEFFCAMYPEKDYRLAIVRAAAEIGRGME